MVRRVTWRGESCSALASESQGAVWSRGQGDRARAASVQVASDWSLRPAPSRARRASRAARRHPIGVFALILVLAVLFLAAFGPTIVDDPNEISLAILEKPSGEHWFGTDGLGRTTSRG